MRSFLFKNAQNLELVLIRIFHRINLHLLNLLKKALKQNHLGNIDKKSLQTLYYFLRCYFAYYLNSIVLKGLSFFFIVKALQKECDGLGAVSQGGKTVLVPPSY